MVRGAFLMEVSHGQVYSAVQGLEVQKDSIAVAHADGGRPDPPVFVSAIGSRHADIDELIRRLRGKTADLRFAYEAGPSGHGLHRYLTSKAIACQVVAPSLLRTGCAELRPSAD